MNAQLNIFTFAHFLLTILKRVRRFLTPDFLVLPALGFLWVMMLSFMVSTFLNTLMPSPCLPAVINSALSVSTVSKKYLELAQVLWSYSDGDGESFSVPQVSSKNTQTLASI
ncbi:MAG: hypothetical protein SXA11_04170 [Cyanobacteriota bacterium]|nr:hypothetical protein [Cyanobacteriota bacterium]